MGIINSSDVLGPKILEMLGVNESRCVRAEIVMEPSKPIVIKIECFADPTDPRAVLRDDDWMVVRKEFKLERIGE